MEQAKASAPNTLSTSPSLRPDRKWPPRLGKWRLSGSQAARLMTCNAGERVTCWLVVLGAPNAPAFFPDVSQQAVVGGRELTSAPPTSWWRWGGTAPSGVEAPAAFYPSSR